jgi:lysophospholipase L1-like esterase
MQEADYCADNTVAPHIKRNRFRLQKRENEMSEKKGSHRIVLFSLVFIMLVVLSLGPLASVSAAPVKIMPLGDSITGSPGCWRALLWQNLTNAGYTDIDFVGSLPDPGCGIVYDGDNEGHGGFLATGIVSNNQLPGWLSAANPDIVMMMLGTNDTWSSLGNTAILGAFTTLVGQMRVNNPNVKIIVAQLTPNNYSGCSQCTPNIITLNAAIPQWATDTSTNQSPIMVVDQFTGYDTTTDTYDGCHPNDSGNVKIASKWYPALVAYLSGVVPTPGPTSTPAPPIDCSGVSEWSTATVFETAGMKTVYNGILYTNNWYSSGQNPETNSGANQVWTRIGPCGISGTVSPTTAPTNPPASALGDVNGSGTVDIVDALLVAQYYVGLNPASFNPANADVNCSGTIDIVDALLVAQYYVGLITLPC